MKIKVKQIWDVELPKDATLGQLKKMAEAIQKDGDSCVLTFNGGHYVVRRVAE